MIKTMYDTTYLSHCQFGDLVCMYFSFSEQYFKFVKSL